MLNYKASDIILPALFFEIDPAATFAAIKTNICQLYIIFDDLNPYTQTAL
jgi:hypothetical protein